MMLQQINKKIIFYISLIIILGTFNNKNLKNFDLPKINMVNIEGIEFNDNEYLKIMNLIKLNNFMNICLLGNNLTNLVLANILIKRKIRVDIISQTHQPLVKKTVRTIAISNENYKFLEEHTV